MTDKILIYTDGASRQNPGPAGAAYIITSPTGQIIDAKGYFLGQATNNVAEYTALQKALEAAKKIGAQNIEIFSDSELMVRQITGDYKVKNQGLKELFDICSDILAGFSKWSIRHIPRAKNTQADELANIAIDKQCECSLPSQKAGDLWPSHNIKTIRLGILLSGGGRTMLNIHQQIQKHLLPAEIAVVISSRSDAKGIERTKKIGKEPLLIRKKDYPDTDSFSTAIAEALRKAEVDLVVQAGWLCLWKIPSDFEKRVMNIHPALLPSFGGKGMWGHHVHEAVLAAGCKVSGCTVHFCNNEYDAGPIIIQRTCPVLENDNADTLAARVFKEECIAYPDAIRLFAQGRLKIESNKVKML